MKKIIALFVLMVLFQPKLGAQNKSETVYIRVCEMLGTTLLSSQMIVIDADNQTKTTKLRRLKDKEDIQENMLELKMEIDIWIKLGYKIDSFSNGGSDNIWVTNIILKKED